MSPAERSAAMNLLAVAMLGGLVTLVVRRGFHGPPAKPKPPASASAAASASGTSAPGPKASGIPGSSASGGSSADPPKKEPLPPTLLRVAATHWAHLAPAFEENGGLSPSKQKCFGASLKVELSVLRLSKQIQAALAKGGEQPEGAHVALMPLSEFLAVSSALPALELQVFGVAAADRGSLGVWAKGDDLLLKPAPGKPIVWGAKRGPQGVFAASTAALYLLELGGHPLKKLSKPTVAPGRAFFVGPAGSPPILGPKTKLMTSAPMAGLDPVVWTAQKSFIASHPKELAQLMESWWGASAKVSSDLPAAARRLSHAPGAPEPLLLVRQLAQQAFADGPTSQRWFGLRGRSAISIISAFRAQYRVLGLRKRLEKGAPEIYPIAYGPLGKVRSKAVLGAPRRPSLADNLNRSLLKTRLPPKTDAAEARVRELLAVFPGQRFVLRGPNKRALQTIQRRLAERFLLAPKQLQVGKPSPRASCEVYGAAAQQ